MTKDQLQCVEYLSADYSKCLPKCEGMEIISYNEHEIDSYLSRYLLGLSNTVIGSQKLYRKYDSNSKLTKLMSKLSNQYQKYKKAYNFPEKYKGKIIKKKRANNVYP